MTDEPDDSTLGADGSDDGFGRRIRREAALSREDDGSESATGGATAFRDENGDLDEDAIAAAKVERARKAKNERKSSTRNLMEWVGVIGGAVIIALVVRTFIFQTFWIPSPSMASTLVEDDRVLVNKLSYKFHDIRRGDVVVFERPPTEPSEKIKDLIKRVIGLPGDRVSITGDGSVRINGRTLEEPYVNDLQTIYNPGCGSGDVTGIDTPEGLLIGEGDIFVMGDNRVNSKDGRCFGPIDEDLVVGRAFFIIWPLSNAGSL